LDRAAGEGAAAGPVQLRRAVTGDPETRVSGDSVQLWCASVYTPMRTSCTLSSAAAEGVAAGAGAAATGSHRRPG
jgi:hypothetical protein